MTVMTAFRGSENPVKAVRVEIGRFRRIRRIYTGGMCVEVSISMTMSVSVSISIISQTTKTNGKCGKFKGTAYLAWIPDTSP